jgi:hypothetical protein
MTSVQKNYRFKTIDLIVSQIQEIKYLKLITNFSQKNSEGKKDNYTWDKGSSFRDKKSNIKFWLASCNLILPFSKIGLSI